MGHVTRCTALAEAWAGAGGTAVLAVDQSVAERAAARTDVEVRTVTPHGTAAVVNDADWLVVDGYSFTVDDVAAWGVPVERTLVVTDHGRGPVGAGSVLLDQNPGVAGSTYGGRTPGSTLLLGPSFALLPERHSQPPRVDGTARRLLVALGGEPAAPTIHLVRDALVRVADLGLSVDVLGGGDLAPLGVLEAVSVHGFVSDPGPWFDRADLAVVAAGTTSWELCRQGIPFVALATVDNQEPVAHALQEAGAALVPPATADGVAGSVRRLAEDPLTRATLSVAGQRLVDGRGAGRVVAALRSRDVRLRPAGLPDEDRLLEWANDPSTRAASFTTDPITPAQHAAWFAARLADPASVLLIAEDDRGPWGLVRFAVDGDRAELGVTVDPGRRGAGLAAPLLRAGVRELFARRLDVAVVDALVRPENAASTAAFDRAGFTRTDQADPVRFEAERTDGW